MAWLTQARPVTTLFPLPAARPTDDLRVYFCFSLAQGLHRPLTPMGLAHARDRNVGGAHVHGLRVEDPLVGPSGVAQAAGRLFFDITTVMQHPVGREAFPKVLDVMEARSAVVLRNLRSDPRLPSSRSRWPFLRRLARIAMRFRIPLVVARAVLRPEATRRRLAEMERDLVRRATPPDDLTAAERLEFVIKMLGETVIPMMPRVMPAAAAGFAMLGLAGKLLGDDADPDDLQGVLRALPHNVTTEMDLALWQVATVIRRNVADADLVRTTPAQELAAMYGRHAARASSANWRRSSTNTVTAQSRRSTLVCRAGRRIPPTFLVCSRTTFAWTIRSARLMRCFPRAPPKRTRSSRHSLRVPGSAAGCAA